MRRCWERFWRECKRIRFAVSENQPIGRHPGGEPEGRALPWSRLFGGETFRWTVKCPWRLPDIGFRHGIRAGRTVLEFMCDNH